MPKRRISVILMGLRTNSDYFPPQWLTGFYNRTGAFTKRYELNLQSRFSFLLESTGCLWQSLTQNTFSVLHYQQINFNHDKSCLCICITSQPPSLYSLNPQEDFQKPWLQCNGACTHGRCPWNTHEIYVSCKLSGPLFAHNWPRPSIQQTGDSFVRQPFIMLQKKRPLASCKTSVRMAAALLWNCQSPGVLIKTAVLLDVIPYSLVDRYQTHTLSQPVTA